MAKCGKKCDSVIVDEGMVGDVEGDEKMFGEGI